MQNAINELHFHPKWFEYELLPGSFFMQQVEKYRHFESDEDSFWEHLEHHRYFAFQTILSSRQELSNSEIEQDVELCLLDEDKDMALSPLIDLLLWDGLTKEQYNKLVEHPAYVNPVAQKIGIGV